MIIKDVYGRVIYESKAGTIREVLEEAVKNKVSLCNADLNRCSIVKAYLDGAILKGASFRGSFLFRASFHKAHLDGADFFWLILAEHLSKALS